MCLWSIKLVYMSTPGHAWFYCHVCWTRWVPTLLWFPSSTPSSLSPLYFSSSSFRAGSKPIPSSLYFLPDAAPICAWSNSHQTFPNLVTLIIPVTLVILISTKRSDMPSTLGLVLWSLIEDEQNCWRMKSKSSIHCWQRWIWVQTIINRAF